MSGEIYYHWFILFFLYFDFIIFFFSFWNLYLYMSTLIFFKLFLFTSSLVMEWNFLYNYSLFKQKQNYLSIYKSQEVVASLIAGKATCSIREEGKEQWTSFVCRAMHEDAPVGCAMATTFITHAVILPHNYQP